MFDSFVQFLLRQRLLVLLAAAVLAGVGVLAWKTLPIDAFPDVTNDQVMILTKAPGLAAVDVEERVSYPIEQVMGGLPKVKQVRSLSKAELSQVVIVFEDGVDTYWTRQVVFERLALAREQLPPGVEPELGPISTGLGEILQYTLESDRHSPMELRTIQDWLVAPRLKPIAGVNEVNSFGGYLKQYQVLVSPEQLLKHSLTANDVVTAIERNNANAGGGILVRGWEQFYLRGVGLLRDIPDIGRIVLRAADATPVYLRDVADITIGTEPRQGAVTRDGRLQKPRPGAGILACEGSVPIVPVLVRGTFDMFSYAHPGFHVHPVGLTFGAPLAPPAKSVFDNADYLALMSAWQEAVVRLRRADDALGGATAGRSPRVDSA